MMTMRKMKRMRRRNRFNPMNRQTTIKTMKMIRKIISKNAMMKITHHHQNKMKPQIKNKKRHLKTKVAVLKEKTNKHPKST